eukprot:752040-Hanusia_phi.AAC.3
MGVHCMGRVGEALVYLEVIGEPYHPLPLQITLPNIYPSAPVSQSTLPPWELGNPCREASFVAEYSGERKRFALLCCLPPFLSSFSKSHLPVLCHAPSYVCPGRVTLQW